ncbi:hypothetical protein GJ496_010320 [Pomphorhynchus laevis]|nr:hypothetical protein GJ496_010320 [Pomphorhynchus laevis]
MPSTQVCLQHWYADDATCIGNLSSIRSVWQEITSIGQGYGFKTNASKCRSAEECFEEKHSIFESLRDEESIKVKEKLSTLQDKLSPEVRVASGSTKKRGRRYIRFSYTQWPRRCGRLPTDQHSDELNRASNDFIDTPATFFRAVAERSQMEKVTLKKAMIFTQCILKDTPSRKISIVRKTMERRMLLWQAGKLEELNKEANILQSKSRQTKHDTGQVEWGRQYSRMITAGRIAASSAILEEQHISRTLCPDGIINGSSVFELLQSLHPEPSPIRECTIQKESIPDVVEHHFSILTEIDEERISSKLESVLEVFVPKWYSLKAGFESCKCIICNETS